MAKMVEVHEINDGSQYLVAEKSANGNVNNITYTCDKPLEIKELGKLLARQLKDSEVYRKKYGTMLALIAKDPSLTPYLGKHEKGDSKIPKNFKDAFNKAEDAFITALVKDKTLPVTKEFITALKETEARNQRDPNNLTAHEIEEFWIRAMVSEFRTGDKNYANVKSTVLKFMTFVGMRPENVQGFIIPVAAMQAMIKSTMEVTPPDNSYAGRIEKIMQDIEKDKKFKEEDARRTLTLLLSLTTTVKAVVAGYDEAATEAREATNSGGVPATAAAAMTRMQRAPRPEEAPV